MAIIDGESEVRSLGPQEWDMKVSWLDADELVPNAENPNEQDDATFNALVRSIQMEGWTEPVTAVWDRARRKYEIVGGEHRWRAGKLLEVKIPVVVLPEDDFNRDRRDWNVVKANVLRGKLNPEKFARLYERMARKYDEETLKALMGFTSEDAFKRVFRQVKGALPPELQQALDDAKEEIRTIDDLALVLNRLFRDHGETLDSNMMVFSWAGKEVLWIRANDDLWKLVTRIADEVAEREGDMAEEMFSRLRYRSDVEDAIRRVPD